MLFQPNSENTNNNIKNPHSFYTQYTILNELGRGAFSTVYKVKSNKNDKIYCVKKIKLNSNTETPLNLQKINEISILQKLSNPLNPNPNQKHIVQYYGNYIENNYLYLIMEFCEYGDIFSLLRSVKKHHLYIQEDILWDISYQSLLGLEYLHSLNIIHRDIKLLNIFMTKDKTVKIGDMGMSKLIENDINQMNMSRVGTPLFLAPELVKKEKYDYKIDIWSLGCSLYHLAKLVPPFNEESLIKLGDAIVNQKPPDLPHIYSNEFKSLVNAMLVKDKNQRVTVKEAIEKFIPDYVKKKYKEKFNKDNENYQKGISEVNTVGKEREDKERKKDYNEEIVKEDKEKEKSNHSEINKQKGFILKKQLNPVRRKALSRSSFKVNHSHNANISTFHFYKFNVTSDLFKQHINQKQEIDCKGNKNNINNNNNNNNVNHNSQRSNNTFYSMNMNINMIKLNLKESNAIKEEELPNEDKKEKSKIVFPKIYNNNYNNPSLKPRMSQKNALDQNNPFRCFNTPNFNVKTKTLTIYDLK